jgi:anaerobic ribonucleoside-triphosphate reductase activating protein
MVRINKIVQESYVDGPGRRTVVFFQGCNIGCAGCQNKALWPAEGGEAYDEIELAKKLAYLAQEHGNMTVTGGEPFNQVASLAKLVWHLKKEGVKDIIVYTGYTWETIMSPMTGVFPWVKTILENVDTVVDGPFVQSLDDPFITYRGSRNQRPIDVEASLAEDCVVTLDWDAPEIVITVGGDALMPVGLAADLRGLGELKSTRMCGQTAPVRL